MLKPMRNWILTKVLEEEKVCAGGIIIPNSVKNKTKFVKYCECGKEIQKRSMSCVDCAKKKNRKVVRPSYEKLIDEVNKFGYSKVGLFYNVTGNTIKSWILQYKKCL